ncbi:MAG: acetate--CoA ligase [Deltaproteobacteria bacterium CG_4_10_14_0_2_um_filter_43_8]|nr:MAG: acetate--CoA ligase [Deltaproteobacteria bacterium CG11_big_fil_rev_8_21_14_0_20_42_23]PJA20204.1 MAG: acetate--CoA ligase [Deltaproteobacteria bacterium CG_4_10_14_0_2_um_filter_43_8]PJC64329.1 MAG: acetate--CoA ligase [Deltaproteobacteria bacterium CG_4_9_14_0_2_um_filter_42_21]
MNNIIESLLAEKRTFPPSQHVKDKTWINSLQAYETQYQQSIQNPENFWADIAKNFSWFQTWNKVCEYDYGNHIDIKWFVDGKTNITVNCLDRHVEAGAGDRIAFYWEGNHPGEEKTISYKKLLSETCKMANALKKMGVKKGDIVTIYMPMIIELPVALLACARIGAVHSVVFGGFSADSIADRMLDAKSQYLLTADGVMRGTKQIDLKSVADEALEKLAAQGCTAQHLLVVKRLGNEINWNKDSDIWWHEIKTECEEHCAPEIMDAEDPLFILYTSGSTGKPKGVLHSTAGYMVYAATTHKYVFDYHPDDIYFCTADIGWITGHSYIVYGPLCNQASSVIFEGIPTFPDSGRFWQMVEKYKVNSFYTAPTALRSLMRDGAELPKQYNLSNLRVLGTVGEPINPEAWMWYYNAVGNKHCAIVDTWWQTETGGVLITSLPGAITAKPGSASLPFFGIEPVILREDGSEAHVNEGGYLCLKKPWPGQMRTVYGEHSRFKETYFSRFPGYYFTGDGARKDEDGYFWLMGRVDDVINVSGHRMGTAEVESALVSHPLVTEAAVVGFPHAIKGEGIYAYVTLRSGTKVSKDLQKELVAHVRKEIGPIASPDAIHFTDALPKTRSGKIMRRILRKIAAGDTENLGDITTLADPNVVNQLVESRPT